MRLKRSESVDGRREASNLIRLHKGREQAHEQRGFHGSYREVYIQVPPLGIPACSISVRAISRI